jgi:hypothetical protein
MTLTEEQQAKIEYLRSSLRLQSPDLETDPVYKFTDEELWDILAMVTPSHNPQHTIDTLPVNELSFVMLLAKKEVYYRLATSTAPFYPLSAEGASLQKNVRFDHYMALIKQTEEDYSSALKLARENGFGTIQTYEQLVQGHHFSRRNYNLSAKPTIAVTVSNITPTTVDVDWTPFSVPAGLFNQYLIYAEKTPLIDEYAYIPFREDAYPKFHSNDIHRLKYRIYGLENNTEYYVCAVSRDRSGLYGYSQVKIKTPPLM